MLERLPIVPRRNSYATNFRIDLTSSSVTASSERFGLAPFPGEAFEWLSAEQRRAHQILLDGIDWTGSLH